MGRFFSLSDIPIQPYMQSGQNITLILLMTNMTMLKSIAGWSRCTHASQFFIVCLFSVVSLFFVYKFGRIASGLLELLVLLCNI